MHMRVELQAAIKCVKNSYDANAYSMPRAHHGFHHACGHGWQHVSQRPILLKNLPQLLRHCECNALVPHVWQSDPTFALPLDRGPMSTNGASSRFAGVI